MKICAKIVPVLIILSVVVFAACGSKGSGNAGEAGIIDGFGTVTGEPGSIGADEITSASPFLVEGEIDFGTDPYNESTDFSELSAGGQDIYNDDFTSGSSLLSCVFAFEVLYRLESATLLKTYNDIEYSDSSGKKADFIISIEGHKAGVNFVRGYHYPPGDLYTTAEANTLLTKKLNDAALSFSNVKEADKWEKQIIVIIAYNSQYAEVFKASWAGLDATLKGNAILFVVTTEGDDSFLYN